MRQATIHARRTDMNDQQCTTMVIRSFVCAAGFAVALTTSVAAPPAEAEASMPRLEQAMQNYSPELRQKVMALSPEIRATLQQLHATHTRHSKELTLRQVMQEILSEFQSVVAAIAVDNAEQAADSARRLANHRIPVGGLLPYMPLNKIDNASIGVLPGLNQIVEGSALKLAAAADQGDMGDAARHLSDIAAGCVACHQVFRGRPGVSTLLAPRSN